jgi:hypothetical protein
MKTTGSALGLSITLLVTAAGCQKSSAPTAPQETTSAPAAASSTTTTTAATASSLSTATSPEDAALAAIGRVLTTQGVDPACVSLAPSRANGRIEVEAREKHGDKCPGDPATAPTIGRYRVSPSGDVSSYDAVSDAWVALGRAPVGPGGAILGTKILEREAKDSAGNHRFVLSRDEHGKSVHLYAYDFCDAPPTPGAPCWAIQDGIDSCDDDLSVDFVGDKLYLKENGGRLAAAVLYRSRCSTDVSAYTMKLVGYENGKKFAVRGTTGLKGAGGATQYEPKRTADVSDAALRPWALATWDKLAIEKL